MTTTTTKTDAEIKREVNLELRWDPRVDEGDIGVLVKQGIVTLTGTTETYAQKKAACDAAHRVPGVLDVANDVDVRIAGPVVKSDGEIAAAVRHALEWDVFVPDRRIKSTVARGWVTLEGDVDHTFQRDNSASAVERLSGVRGVTNSIVVKSLTVDASKVRASIQEALERLGEREAKAISIRVHDGVVSLSGMVRSWSEKNEVERVASFAPGVRSVNNELTINSFA